MYHAEAYICTNTTPSYLPEVVWDLKQWEICVCVCGRGRILSLTLFGITGKGDLKKMKWLLVCIIVLNSPQTECPLLLVPEEAAPQLCPLQLILKGSLQAVRLYIWFQLNEQSPVERFYFRCRTSQWGRGNEWKVTTSLFSDVNAEDF